MTDGTRVSQADGSLRVGGPDQPEANLTVYGEISAASASFTGALTVGGNLSSAGPVTVGGTLTLAGGVLDLTSITAQEFTATDNVTTPSLSVGGPTTAAAVSATSVTSSGPITSTGDISSDGNIVATGGLIGSTLQLHNMQVDSAGNITNAGSATFAGAVNCNGGFQAASASITGTLNVNGALTAESFYVGTIPGFSATFNYTHAGVNGTATFENGLLVGLS